LLLLNCGYKTPPVLSYHSQAFSSSELAAAKDRLAQLQDFQSQLNSAWKGVRWLMDILTFARDRGISSVSSGSCVATPGVTMRNLLTLNWSSSAEQGCDREVNSIVKDGSNMGGGSLKRSLLQLPPRDPKVVKSSTSRGSWPGPGVSPSGVASFLTSELSKSEQHLNMGRSDGLISSSSTASTITTDAGSNCSLSVTG